MILQPRIPQGFRSTTRERPYTIRDTAKHLNEAAVVVTEPRTPVLILSFSNPQARIIAEGYRFVWWEGETLHQGEDPKLTHPVVIDIARRFQAFSILADTDLVIDEVVLMKGQDQQIANFSFKDRFVSLHRPDFHLEWTEGVTMSEALGGGEKKLILGPEALG